MSRNRVVRLLATVGIALSFAACHKETKEQKLKAVVAALPFMLQYYDNCNHYTDATADADKVDLSRAAGDAIKTYSVTNARGKIETVLPRGPANAPTGYTLQVLVQDTVHFLTDAKDRAINRGDPLFAVVAKMRADDCVVISGKNLSPVSKFQRDVACNPRFYMKFTSVAPCK